MRVDHGVISAGRRSGPQDKSLLERTEGLAEDRRVLNSGTGGVVERHVISGHGGEVAPHVNGGRGRETVALHGPDVIGVGLPGYVARVAVAGDPVVGPDYLGRRVALVIFCYHPDQVPAACQGRTVPYHAPVVEGGGSPVWSQVAPRVRV